MAILNSININRLIIIATYPWLFTVVDEDSKAGREEEMSLERGKMEGEKKVKK